MVRYGEHANQFRPNIIPGYRHIPTLLFHGTIDPHQHQHVVFNIPKKKKTILKKLFLEVTPPWNNLRREGPCFWEGGGIAWDQRLSLSILCSLVHYQ